MNYAFRHLKLPHRVLPMQVGNLKLFRKVADSVRLQGVLMEEEYFEKLHEAAKLDESSKAPVQSGDYLSPSDEGWNASNTFGEYAVNSLLFTIRTREPDATEPLKGRSVLFAGCGGLTRMMAARVKEQGGVLMFASKDRNEAQRISQVFGGRVLHWEAIYQTLHDVLIVSRDGAKPEEEDEELPIHPGYLRAAMYVLDATSVGVASRFLREARLRGCGVVHPGTLLIEQVRSHIRRVAGQEIDSQVLADKLIDWMPAEEE
jgi:shikimate 5-dehydrogenase